MNSFVILAKLPSLNDYILACRANRYKGAQFKHDVEELIGWNIRQALAKKTLQPTSDPLTVNFVWHEKTKRRDADNIASAKKYILDAMQRQGIIPNDNRKYIRGFTDIIIDDTDDYVEVELVPIE